ncbi:MAG: c-type cytochrome [Pseudomonadota bacterium]
MKTRTISKLTFAILGGVLLAQNASAQPSEVFKGYKLFNETCFLCHGLDGKGEGPLSSKLNAPVEDLTNNADLAKKSDRDLFRIIQGTTPHGSINQSMPKWGLAIPAPQIESLVSYIRFLHQAKHSLVGDPVIGKDVYQRYCAVCHGSNGKGNGPLANIMKMNPADHTNTKQMDEFTNERLAELISEGGVSSRLMPGWKEILSEDEIKAVISYIRLLSSR